MANYEVTLVHGQNYYLKGKLFKNGETHVVNEETKNLLESGAVYDEKVQTRDGHIENRPVQQFTIRKVEKNEPGAKPEKDTSGK